MADNANCIHDSSSFFFQIKGIQALIKIDKFLQQR
jgi:hypothetical protein